MYLNEELNGFINIINQYDWFCSAEFDSLGKFIVFVSKMDIPFIGNVSNKIGGHQILFHYVSSKYSIKITSLPSQTSTQESDRSIASSIFEPELDLDFLILELEKLEDVCGYNILADIFYEIHDQKNAVTNLSYKFPKVRSVLEYLYDEFGFDIIHTQLDC